MILNTEGQVMVEYRRNETEVIFDSYIIYSPQCGEDRRGITSWGCCMHK